MVARPAEGDSVRAVGELAGLPAIGVLLGELEIRESFRRAIRAQLNAEDASSSLRRAL